MEACASNLKEFVSGNYNGPLIHTSKIDILKQLTCGLDFLHGKKIFHRDLKPFLINSFINFISIYMDSSLAAATPAVKVEHVESPLTEPDTNAIG